MPPGIFRRRNVSTAALVMAAFSLGLAARMVVRFGIRIPLAAGLLLAAAGTRDLAEARLEA